MCPDRPVRVAVLVSGLQQGQSILLWEEASIICESRGNLYGGWGHRTGVVASCGRSMSWLSLLTNFPYLLSLGMAWQPGPSATPSAGRSAGAGRRSLAVLS